VISIDYTLQNIEEAGEPFFVTLNPDHVPKNTLLKWSTGHPVPSVAAYKASVELDRIQGKRRIWFSGAYQGTFLLIVFTSKVLVIVR
jgi:cyclopropane-fatty-acyl-phospholipid synthase